MENERKGVLINDVLPKLFKKSFLPLLINDKSHVTVSQAIISDLNKKIEELEIPPESREEIFGLSSIMFFEGLLSGGYEKTNEHFHTDKGSGGRMILKATRERTLREFALKLFAAYFSENLHKQRVAIAMCLTGMMEHPYNINLVPYVDAIAETDDPVLILGETGSGKELLAKAVHYLSMRSRNDFIATNCGGIHEESLHSELFGHDKGAFTGAIKDREGAFEAANRGTIFLDEVGDMPMKVQIALLRTLNDGKFLRLGAKHGEERQTDVRVIAATNKDLLKEIEEGRFREDLYYRLCVHPLRLPAFRDLPINDRIFKIRTMIDTVLKEQSGKDIHSTLTGLDLLLPSYSYNTGQWTYPLERDETDLARWPISKEALDILLNYKFPGNYRQLHSAIKNAWVKTKKRMEVEHLPAYVLSGATEEISPSAETLINLPEKEYRARIKEIEQERITRLLKQTKGNVSAAARTMGVKRHKLERKMSTLGLQNSIGKETHS